MDLLADRVAVISGVGDGLGGDAARLFAREGARVVMLARQADIVEAIAGEISASGGSCIWCTGDIRNSIDCQGAVARALEEFGRVDVLVNVAGKGDRATRIPLLEIDEDFTPWRESYEINVIGTMKMTRAVVPHMMERRTGRIIMVNTMTSERVRPYSYAYSASKSALQRITEVLALELGPYGIRVNGIHPGFMWGPVMEETMERESRFLEISQAEWKQRIERNIPLGYIPPTSEFAGVLCFLASDLSSPMTGASLYVDGGQQLR
jgi:NAD(P)-dependent dehydrogenase (short-subunit alcohol dehydrogenase family)